MNLYFDEEEAVEKLQELGYRVVKEEFPDTEFVHTVKDLVNYFYTRRKYYNPDRKFPFSIDYSEATKRISGFVKSRQKLGLSRKMALRECAILVDNLFKYEAVLLLKEPIINPGILTSRPVMDKICSLVNREVREVAEVDNGLFIDELNVIYDEEFGVKDSNIAQEIRKEILEASIDVENGRGSKA